MQKRKLVMHGNVLIFQMISMRDKATGKYLPLMDGNVNSMLHRIYSNLKNIDKVVMLFPTPDLCDAVQYAEFEKYVAETFEGKVTIQPTAIYEADVASTRRHLLAIGDYDKAEKLWMSDVELIVSEFPINFTETDAKVVYNYNWGAVDDTNKLLNESFEAEIALASRHETYLYSNVQYNYWLQQDAISNNVFRSIEIFDKELFLKIAENNYEKALQEENAPIANSLKLISRLTDTAVFFPMRVDDPRYNFNEIFNYCEASHKVLIVTNPTGVALPESKKCTLIDLTNCKDKRSIYFYILKTLRSCDVIIHHESDMHISLLEHIAISRATTLHSIIGVEEYLVNNN